MSHKVFTYILPLFLLSACATHSTSPIDAEKAVVISDPKNLMSHCPSTHIFPDGEVWVAHYRDSVGNIEDPLKLSIEVVLSRFDIKDWQSPEILHTHLFKAGETLGDFTQGDYAAYDPILFDADGTMRCIIQALEKGDNDSCLAAFEIDRESGTPRDNMMRCTLTYSTKDGDVRSVPFKASALCDFYRELGVEDFTHYERPLIDKTFVRHGEWAYNVLCGWWGSAIPPTIIRTKDGVNYEAVFACFGYDFGSTEAAIAIHNDLIYLIGRSHDPRKGSFLGCFTLSGECVRTPYQVGDVSSRPEMIVHKGKLYAMYNIKPNFVDENGKEVYRSRARISELNGNADEVRSWEYSAPNSMQYFFLDEYKGEVYLTFTEDRFNRADKKKGDIAFVKTKL